MNKVLTKLLQK